MEPPAVSLAELRRQLDEIDDRIHDLIMRRADIVAEVSQAKEHSRGRGVLRPGREAQILRRLVARHQGVFPVASLVRIWRELISASVAQQAYFAAAVFRPEPDPGYWDLAREQFGIHAPMVAHTTPEAAIAAARSGEATVAVVPLPADEEDHDWWVQLALAPAPAGDEPAPQIIWHLPFTGYSSGPSAGLEAVVVSLTPQEESGDDRSIFVFEIDAAGGLADLDAAFRAQGLEVRRQVHREAGEKGLALVVLDGYIGAQDPRLAAAAGGSGRLHGLGGYPVPFEVDRPRAKE